MATRVTDTFTDADLVRLDAHIGELGATWTALTGMAGANKPAIFTNRLFGFDATNCIYLTSGTATTDGESITASLQKFDATSCAVGPCLRGNSTTNSCYAVFWAPDGTLAIYRVISSVMTSIASGTAAISNGTHTVQFKATGTGASVVLEIFIDGSGTPALSFTDTDAARLVTPGKFGVYLAGATGGGAGIHFNDVSASDAAAATPTFTYTTPVNRTIQQRSSGVGTLSITGTYTGSPTTIEARLVDDGTNTPVTGFDWSTKVASPSGSSFSFTFTNVPESLGWRNVQIRDSANPGNIFTSGKVAVGALFSCVNQSNVANFCYVGSSTLTANDSTAVYGRVGTWQLPQTATMDGAITFLNTMVASLGVVCGWLDTAKSGSGLDPSVFDPWLPTSTSPNYSYFTSTVAAVGGTEGVVSAAGENDANGGVSQATFYTDLGLLYSAIRTDTGKPNLPIVMATLGRVLIGGYATDAQAEDIRSAQAQKAGDANIYRVDRIDLPLAGDNIHHTAAGYQTLAARCARAMLVALGFVSQYRGPSILSAAQLTSNTYRVTLSHHYGTDFTPTSSIGGWHVTDPGAGGAAITVTAAVRSSATTVDLTLASTPVSLPYVGYLYGIAPSITNVLKDNSALNLPLEYNSGVLSTNMPAATSVTLTFENRAGTLQANLTNMKWAFFDQASPDLLLAPVAKGAVETTNGSGVLVLDITGSTLLPGAVGYVIFSNTDGTVAQSNMVAFAGPAEVA